MSSKNIQDNTYTSSPAKSFTTADSDSPLFSNVISINKRTQCFVFSESGKRLVITASINMLVITGNNNTITVKSSVPLLIVNGEYNKVKAIYYPNSLCDIVFNGNNNKIIISKMCTFINKEDNGRKNKLAYHNTNHKGIKRKLKCIKKNNNNNNENSDEFKLKEGLTINQNNCELIMKTTPYNNWHSSNNSKLTFSVNMNEIAALFAI
jgi:hypothetical protein